MKFGVYLLAALLIVASNSFASGDYTAKKGDTLYSISKKFNTTVKELKRLNNLSSDSLKIGTSLKVPSTYTNYTIKSGDTLGTIAIENGLNSSKDLIEFNKLENANIRVGQKILIPNKNYRSISNSKNSYYTVESGDHLIFLADKFNVSVKSLKELNNISSDNLKIGQRILVPANDVSSTKVVKAESTAVKDLPKKVNPQTSSKHESNQIKPSNGVYVVRSGDTLSQIAERFGVKTNDLRSFNNISGNNIRAGQNLNIPYITVEPVVADNKPTQPKPVKTSDASNNLKVKTNKEISQTSSGTKSTYIVKRGDTVSQIAEKFGISTSDLKLYNDLENNNIRVGQSLKLPYITRTVAKKVTVKPVVISKKPATTFVKKKSAKKIAAEPVKAKPKYTHKYIVKGDDTLNKIAEKFNTTTKELRSENKLSNNIIYVGQQLKVSSDKPIILAEKPKKATTKNPSKKTEIYVVRKGDTLHSISRKFVTDVKTLKEFNGLTSNDLKIGRVLKVPSSSLSYSESGKLVYKVSNGDSLGAIADNFGVSVASIKSANNLNSNNISAGSKLIIPSKSKSSTSKTKKASNKTAVKYKVKKGDTLSSIARNHNTSVDSIKETNGLNGHSILRGQTLTVPSSIQKSRKNSKKQKKITKNNTNNVEKLIKVAKKYLGAPYKFGGTSTKTGIDCSAYVNKVFRSVDVNLPRTARAIYKKGNHVSKKHLNKGDLVFFRTYAKFPSHVGIYLGDGKFIHASSAKKKVTITNLNKRYYQKRYIGAKRIPIKSIRYSKKFDKDQKL